jgi:hypothetical protein
MDKFKVAGNVILINRTGNEFLNDSIKIGDECTVTMVLDKCLQLNGLDDGWVEFTNVKLIMSEPAALTLPDPDWDIYNNSIPWVDLDFYQKDAFFRSHYLSQKKVFSNLGLPLYCTILEDNSYVYRARRFSNSEPELTMVEKFEADWNTCLVTLGCESMWDKMIAKGWVKNSDEPTAGSM